MSKLSEKLLAHITDDDHEEPLTRHLRRVGKIGLRFSVLSAPLRADSTLRDDVTQG